MVELKHVIYAICTKMFSGRSFSDHDQQHLERRHRFNGVRLAGREFQKITGPDAMRSARDRDLGLAIKVENQCVIRRGVLAQPFVGVESKRSDSAGFLFDYRAANNAAGLNVDELSCLNNSAKFWLILCLLRHNIKL